MRNAALTLGLIGGLLAMFVGFFGFGYTEFIENNGEQYLADAYGITNNGFGTLNGTTPPTDSDLDGMPDVWEITLNGLNGMTYNVAADDHNTVFTAGQIPSTFLPAGTPAGYTYLEEYLHFLAVPHATVVKNTGRPAARKTVSNCALAAITSLHSLPSGQAGSVNPRIMSTSSSAGRWPRPMLRRARSDIRFSKKNV
mgnify:CR=1 FL=1